MEHDKVQQEQITRKKQTIAAWLNSKKALIAREIHLIRNWAKSVMVDSILLKLRQEFEALIQGKDDIIQGISDETGLTKVQNELESGMKEFELKLEETKRKIELKMKIDEEQKQKILNQKRSIGEKINLVRSQLAKEVQLIAGKAKELVLDSELLNFKNDFEWFVRGIGDNIQKISDEMGLAKVHYELDSGIRNFKLRLDEVKNMIEQKLNKMETEKLLLQQITDKKRSLMTTFNLKKSEIASKLQSIRESTSSATMDSELLSLQNDLDFFMRGKQQE